MNPIGVFPGSYTYAEQRRVYHSLGFDLPRYGKYCIDQSQTLSSTYSKEEVDHLQVSAFRLSFSAPHGLDEIGSIDPLRIRSCGARMN